MGVITHSDVGRIDFFSKSENEHCAKITPVHLQKQKREKSRRKSRKMTTLVTAVSQIVLFLYGQCERHDSDGKYVPTLARLIPDFASLSCLSAHGTQGERNFHILYELVAGAARSGLAKKLKVTHHALSRSANAPTIPGKWASYYTVVVHHYFLSWLSATVPFWSLSKNETVKTDP